MGSSFRPQSELANLFLGLAQPCGVATRCRCDCIMRVAQDIKGHADLASSSPSSPIAVRKLTGTRYQSTNNSSNYTNEFHSFHSHTFVYLYRYLRLCAVIGAVSPDTYNWQRGLRSLPHLREQLKPRTDDGHASPVPPFLRKNNVSTIRRWDF